MKIVPVKKIFAGRVSLRDYLVNRAILQGESVRIEFEDTYMILTPEELKNGINTKQTFISRFTNTAYTLIDYPFKPVKVDPESPNISQMDLFNH